MATAGAPHDRVGVEERNDDVRVSVAVDVARAERVGAVGGRVDDVVGPAVGAGAAAVLVPRDYVAG